MIMIQNREEAYRRRGAPFTFNPNLLLNKAKVLKNNQTSDNQTVFKFPSWSHSIGDPVDDQILVHPW